MKAIRTFYHLARADFFERTRRYSFLVMLGLMLWIGYAMASGLFRITVHPNYFGVIDSAWVGATMTVATSLVLGLVGFYIVKGSVARDYDTRVGQIMATTPMSGRLYLLGKWLSNYAVLGITIAILALAGIGMQLWFGQGGLDIVALVAPLVLIGLPWFGLVAALAVLFDAVAWLRGGLGNIVYVILWFAVLLGTANPAHLGKPGYVVNPYVDVTGLQIISANVSRSARAVYSDATGFGFGDPGYTDPQFFPFNGIEWTAGILVSRLLFLLLEVGLVLLASVLFDRFDPARLRRVKHSAVASEPAPAPSVEPVPVSGVRLTPLPQGPETRFRFQALLASELKLFVKGQRWWWYAAAAGLVVAQVVAPADALPYLLVVAWVWPVLMLSGVGCRENRFDTRQIVFSAPRPMSQLLAGWLPAALVVAVLGSGALARFLLAGDGVAILGWLTAVVFIPSLALALGTLSGSGKAFEVVYVVWMYFLVQQVPPLDFAGLVPGSHFYLYAPVALGLLAIAALGRRRQLQMA